MCQLVARLVGALTISSFSLTVAAAPPNLGAGLREMVMKYEAQGPAAAPDFANGPSLRGTPRSASDGVRHDIHGHVAVSIHLDGKIALADAANGLRALGAEIQTARNLTPRGEVSAFVPIEKVSAMASMTGVRSIMLSHAKFHVGSVTSEGAAVLHTDRENMQGITGDGITVAALSNSYNTAGGPIDAPHDVASGDLPGVGNPLGDTKPVVVVLEDPTPSDDEGRAMLQIVHDLAPDAKLCFATADIDPISFASAILDLADTHHGCKADVMVDDVSYDVEPYFSDGLIANAVNTVASGGVSYYSSAGNDNQESYDSNFEHISDKRARSLQSPVHWEQVPEDLTAGGFHNFGSDRNPDVLQTVSTALGADYMVLQWNDPWNVGGITARYVMLVFDSQGHWLNNPNDPQGLGGVDDTFATDVAFQEAFLPGPSASDPAPAYYVAYARASTQRTPAEHIRSLLFFGHAQYASHTLPFSPQVYGHSAANGAVSVAADYWDDVKGTEYFSSLGPVTIYFDGDGNRLGRPVTRLKPDITAVDGVHTTFFLQFIDNSGFPSFFGTSAAAPHAAGVAALLLQAAGGPDSMAPAVVKRILIDTAHAHPAHDGHIRAFGRNNGLEVSFTGRGFVRLDPTKFSLSFTDNQERNRTLRQFDIDVAPAGLVVAGSFDVGDPGDLRPRDITPITAVFPSSTLSISFAPGAFRSDDGIAFGFRFNEASILLLGRNVSVLAGSKFRATFSDGTIVTGTLDDQRTRAWSQASGFGLIDAQAAIGSLKTGHD